MVAARLRGAGLSSMAAARSEGGGVEVDGGGAIMIKSGTRMAWGRGRLQRALSLGSRRRCAPGPGTKWWRAPGSRSRMTCGGSGATVSRVTEEQERAQG
jgi:hypothetical protein